MRRKRLNFKNKKRILFVFKIVLSLLIVFLVIERINNFLFVSKFFEIRQINSNLADLDFDYLKGKNIFKLDLKREVELLRRMYPECSKIRIFKMLPNQLYIECIKRKPLAKIYFRDNFFYVDEEAVFFKDLNYSGDLPIIRGLERRIYFREGKVAKLPETLILIKIIKEFTNNPLMSNFKIRELTFEEIDSLSLLLEYLKNPNKLMRLRLNREDFKEKIDFFPLIVSQVKNRSIEYIDLRFKDPIVKINNEE